MNIHEYVVDLDLRHEETKRTNCPACGGYKTFTASNNMGALLWNCYKASCAVGGKSRIRMSIADLQRVANKCHTNNSTGNEEKFVPPTMMLRKIGLCILSMTSTVTLLMQQVRH